MNKLMALSSSQHINSRSLVWPSNESISYEARKTWIQIPPLTLIGWVTLDKSLNLSAG